MMNLHLNTDDSMDSPKDSGVDISSPERKLDELGDTSQESSPRILSNVGIQDISRPSPKYVDVCSINRDNFSFQYNKPLVAHIGGSPTEYDGLQKPMDECHTACNDEIENGICGSDVSINSKCVDSIECRSFDQSLSTHQSFTCAAGQSMASKSTCAAGQTISPRSLSSKSNPISKHQNNSGKNILLSAPLTNSPSKLGCPMPDERRLIFSHQNEPSKYDFKSQTHRHHSAPTKSGFLSEFEKFLQTKCRVREEKTLSSKALASRHRQGNFLCLYDSVADVNSNCPCSVSHNVKPVVKQTPLDSDSCGQESDIDDELSSTQECSLPVDKSLLADNQAAWSRCKHTPAFNVRRFMLARKRLSVLRNSTMKFLKQVFPGLNYPCSQRALHTIDILLNQILDCLRDGHRTKRKLRVISCDPVILDIRILTCQSPQSCLKHLRKKILHVLHAIFPQLDLHQKIDATSVQVDALLEEVTLCNTILS